MRIVKTDAQFHKILLLLVCVGLILRVLAVLALGDFRNPTTAEYGAVAHNLVAGKGFVGGGWLGPEAPTALNTPIYPLFLAGWLTLGGAFPFLWVELCQAVLSASIVWFVAHVTLRLCDRFTGLLAAGLVAFYPPLIYFCKQISPGIFSAFFAIASLYVLFVFLEKPTLRMAVGSGIVFGIALLVEPVLLIALPGAAFFARHLLPENSDGAFWGRFLMAATVCGIVLLPWMIRNYSVFQRFVLLKTSFGLNFWMGNNPNATGIQYTTAGEPMQNTLQPQMRDYLAGLNEAQRYAVLAERAWEWIQAHPQRFLALVAKRIGYLWWISPTYQLTTENIVEPRFLYTIRAWIQAPVLLFGLAGGILALKLNRRLLVQCLWWIVVFTLPYAVSIAGNTRYRLPAEPMVLMLIAFFLSVVTRRVLASPSHVPSMEVRMHGAG